MSEANVRVRFNQEGPYFECVECGFKLEEVPGRPAYLEHPLIKWSFVGKETPIDCEFAGRILRNTFSFVRMEVISNDELEALQEERKRLKRSNDPFAKD